MSGKMMSCGDMSVFREVIMSRKFIPLFAAALLLTSCGRAESAETPSAAQTAVTQTAKPQTTAAETSAAAETETSAAETETAAEEAVSGLPSEAYVETGTFDQYRCELAGATACGATAGTLILQSISYLSGNDLYQRMNTIRSYSALGDDYSCGAPQYYLAGFQISASLNKYLEDNGFEGYLLTDHRTEKSTEQTLMELVATGRPAVLEVCYANGSVLPDFQGYSHWICINGYRTTENGVEFRYSDTIAVCENWVSSELLDESNANVSYGDFYIQPERYIVSFERPLL